MINYGSDKRRVNIMRKSLITAALLLAANNALAPDPINCGSCAEWNKPVAPFNIYGNTYYVGTAGLSSVLVTSPQGHVLLDGALPQSAPLIQKNIEALGFRMQDVKLILNSHAHFDHAGGIAALQKASGATVAHSAHGARVLREGAPAADEHRKTRSVRR